MTGCPHCHADNPVGPHKVHVCADNRPWTQAEKDEWRAQARRRSPSVQFVSTFRSERMGRLNRRAA